MDVSPPRKLSHSSLITDGYLIPRRLPVAIVRTLNPTHHSRGYQRFVMAMASFVARRAFSTSLRRFDSSEKVLKQETKRNPELIILGGVMVAALSGAGFYFGRSPTTSTSESNIRVAAGSMPWETGASEGKYRYHPGGDKNAEPKDAPSAVNVVVVPDVNLPKDLHDKYNKWGKDGY